MEPFVKYYTTSNENTEPEQNEKREVMIPYCLSVCSRLVVGVEWSKDQRVQRETGHGGHAVHVLAELPLLLSLRKLHHQARHLALKRG